MSMKFKLFYKITNNQKFDAKKCQTRGLKMFELIYEIRIYLKCVFLVQATFCQTWAIKENMKGRNKTRGLSVLCLLQITLTSIF